MLRPAYKTLARDGWSGDTFMLGALRMDRAVSCHGKDGELQP